MWETIFLVGVVLGTVGILYTWVFDVDAQDIKNFWGKKSQGD